MATKPKSSSANLPQESVNSINAAAAKYGLNPTIMLGTILTESNGQNVDPKTYGTNADGTPRQISGVAQFDNATWKAVTGLEPPASNYTFDQQVDASAKYMAQCMGSFPSNPQLGITAYNSGVGSARQIQAIMQTNGGDFNAAVAQWGQDNNKPPAKVQEVQQYSTKVVTKGNVPVNVVASNAPGEAVQQEGTAVGARDLSGNPASDSALQAANRTSRVVYTDLSNTPWYKDQDLVVGNKNIKNMRSVWFQVLVSETEPLSATPGGPPLELRLNCSLASLDLTMKHKMSKTNTRTGMHVCLWGMEPDIVQASGSTGAWMNQYGLTTFMSTRKAGVSAQMEAFVAQSTGGPSDGTSPDFRFKSKQPYRVAAQDAFAELLALFKYNSIYRYKTDHYDGYFQGRTGLGDNLWSEKFGSSLSAAAARNGDVMYRGSVLMGTKDDVYSGYFKSLNFVEDAERPNRWNFTMSFQVQSKLTVTGSPLNGASK